LIGRIEFPAAGGTLQATLEDDRTWSCSDRLARNLLNSLAPAAPWYMPPAGQLHDGAALRSGRVIEEVELEEPDLDFIEY
tara:strand:+ start:69 stop:308 length:240 start_codon:yes stop_codon:yes gene_type:complete